MRLLSLILLVLLSQCSDISNNKLATIYSNGDTTFIELTGKRKPLVHSPGIPHLIKDTLLLKIIGVNNGLIQGKEIYVDTGYYKYAGSIEISADSLFVDLQYINTDDSKIVPLSYNGRYKVKIKK